MSKKVYHALERRAVFFLPVQGSEQYKLLDGSRIWKREDKLTEEEYERTGSGSLFLSDVASNIIGQLFGFENNSSVDSALIETCDGGPDWMFTIDADKCPYTLKSLEAACQTLADMINNGEPFEADKPRSVNRSGNDTFPDPVTVYSDFSIPAKIKNLLKRRRVKNSDTCER